MKRISTATGFLALVAMFVLGVFSAGSAMAVSQFLWTGPLPGKLLVLSDGPQIFHATAELGFTCKHFKGQGTISNGSAMTAKTGIITGNYSSCEQAGLKVNVSEVEYELSAEGSVAVIGKPIILTVPALGCSLKINNGAPNNNLKTLTYLNKAQDLLVDVNVKGITSLGSGGVCGPEGKEQTEGTYEGVLLAFVDGGTLKWDA